MDDRFIDTLTKKIKDQVMKELTDKYVLIPRDTFNPMEGVVINNTGSIVYDYIGGYDCETLCNIFKPLIVRREFGTCMSDPPCIQVFLYEGNKQTLRNAIKRYRNHYDKQKNELIIEKLFDQTPDNSKFIPPNNSHNNIMFL